MSRSDSGRLDNLRRRPIDDTVFARLEQPEPASIASGDLAGVQRVKRAVANVSGKALTVNAAVSGMVGITTVISRVAHPWAYPVEALHYHLHAHDGEAERLHRRATDLDRGGYSVRSPIVVRPVALAAPAAVSSGGPINYDVTSGTPARSRRPRGGSSRRPSRPAQSPTAPRNGPSEADRQVRLADAMPAEIRTLSAWLPKRPVGSSRARRWSIEAWNLKSKSSSVLTVGKCAI